MKTILKIRNRSKKKKPEFLRQEYRHHPIKLGRKWRQPMGRTSKLRMKQRSRGQQPSIGFGSPAGTKGLTRFGYRLVRVSNAGELSRISDPKGEMALIISGVGNKNKAEILKAAKEKSILIFNRPKRSTDKPKKIIKPDKKEEKPKKPEHKHDEHKHEHEKENN